MRITFELAFSLCTALLAIACGDQQVDKKPPGPPPTLVTVTEAKSEALVIVEHTLGTLEAVQDPRIGAEIAGRVLRVAVRSGEAVRKGQLLAEIDASDVSQQHRADRAELARLETLLAQQERLLARQNELVHKQFISRHALEDTAAQRDALKNQIEAARARVTLSGSSVDKTRIRAPFDGVVEERIAAEGDYLKLGDPVLRLVSNRLLRAHLPFPESAMPRLRQGQKVRLSSPLLPGKEFAGEVEDIRPTLSESSRAVDVIVRVDNTGDVLKGGGSVDAAVVIDVREAAILAPEQAVVLRPAGRVVYAIVDGKAQQRVVHTGERQDGWVEITSGLAAGERIALDGAGFLTDGAPVNVQERSTATPKGPGGKR